MQKHLKKAYNNKEFLNGKQARPIRVLCELLEPEERLEANKVKNTIVFFGSARPKSQDVANRELKDFEESLNSSPQMTDEKKLESTRLRRIKKLSKYYDDAVRLANQAAGPEKQIQACVTVSFALEEDQVSWRRQTEEPVKRANAQLLLV